MITGDEAKETIAPILKSSSALLDYLGNWNMGMLAEKEALRAEAAGRPLEKRKAEWSEALQFFVRANDIVAANRAVLGNGDLVKVGQRLKIVKED